MHVNNKLYDSMRCSTTARYLMRIHESSLVQMKHCTHLSPPLPSPVFVWFVLRIGTSMRMCVSEGNKRRERLFRMLRAGGHALVAVQVRYVAVGAVRVSHDVRRWCR